MEIPACIEWGAAAKAQPGQTVSGDRFLIAPFENGILIAVADGLGHGAGAAAAAETAVNILRAHASEPVLPLVRTCHAALAQTRGAALTLASLNARDGCMTWLGIGNVEGLLFHAEPNSRYECVTLRGGVVGYQLPPLRAAVLPVVQGDLLVLATDGICSAFTKDVTPAQAPQTIADRVLHCNYRGTDDALVLVVRYLGGAA